MKAVRDAVICFTPPYGKFATRVQMFSCRAAMQPTLYSEVGPVRLAQMPTLTLGRPRVSDQGKVERPGNYLDLAALASLMHWERNCLRSLPCNPFSSACLEHSIDSGLCAFSALVAGVVEGAVVFCAKAGLASSNEATAAAAARDEMVIMDAPLKVKKGVEPRASMMNRG